MHPWLNWIEHLTTDQEVTGSNPVGCTSSRRCPDHRRLLSSHRLLSLLLEDRGSVGADRSLASIGVTLTEPQNSSSQTSISDDDERFMRLALEQARLASDVSDEVPIGAVVVLDGEVLASAHNETRTRKDPTAHAEVLAIRAAARSSQSMRLVGATVYTTVEPCFMCAGALSHARVARVVWGVRDPKFGGCVSLGDVLTKPGLNHQIEYSEGVCADEARELLQSFFRSKRTAKAAESGD